MSEATYDVAIIGAGMAGKSAALSLARVCHSVALIDAGVMRNQTATHVHNLLGFDGMSHADFAAATDEQLAAYPTITRLRGLVLKASQNAQGFTLEFQDAPAIHARKLILAAGAQDLLPPGIPGLQEEWGKRVLHCIYCHGYETRGGTVGLLYQGFPPDELVRLSLPFCAEPVVFLNGMQPPAEALAYFQRFHCRIAAERIAQVSGGKDALQVTLQNGEAFSLSGLFVRPLSQPNNALAVQLGCALQPNGTVVVDSWGASSVPGVYAAGDLAGWLNQLAAAAASGIHAAMGVHGALVEPLIKVGG